MIWDRWYLQPWAWIWSNLERDRLGFWGVLGMVGLTALIPAAGLGDALGGVFGAMIGMIVTAVGAQIAIIQINRIGMRRAQRAGWQTVFWMPTSWAVWRQTAQVLGVDPCPAVPHWERHTIVTPWAGASPQDAAHAFRRARRREWQALADAEASVGAPVHGILISHTFSTIGGIVLRRGRTRQGTPFAALPRRETRELPWMQAIMFGDAVPLRPGHDVGDPAQWWVVWLPLQHMPYPPNCVHTEFGCPVSSPSEIPSS